MKLVIVESPYAGEVEENLRYLRECLHDSIKRGEAPFASHGLYTQPGVLDDSKPSERELGIRCGFAWGEKADLVAFYTDRGWSTGMILGLKRALNTRKAFQVRSLTGSVSLPPEMPESRVGRILAAVEP